MLVLLGAFHGINPGMGWLFAVALGMQENRSAAVWRAIVPIGVGHACAVAAAVALGILAGIVLPFAALRWPVAVVLVALGVRRLLRHGHPRFGSMRIGAGGLTIWSFLIASAHGAGLMVLPIWLHMSPAFGDHAAHGHATTTIASGLAATALHSGSYLVMTALIAVIVFHTLGVGLLRKAWINLDLIWAAALITSGSLTLLLPSA
jgi:hypothetical protein